MPRRNLSAEPPARPTLLAFLSLLIPNTPGLIRLNAGSLALLAYDLSTVRQVLAPR